MSEPVRFTAVTTLFAVNDAASLPAMIEALGTEESRRVQNRIAQGLADKGWEVPATSSSVVSKTLPPGFILASGRVQRA
jgi:HEAT repeat protein